MRRARLFTISLLLLLVALPTGGAIAAEPNAVDDPVAIFNDDAPEVGGAGDAAVAGIAAATVEDEPAVTATAAAAPPAAPAATTASAAPRYRAAATQQLPFTGIDSGLIPVISLLASLLLSGGGLLHFAAGSRRRDPSART